MIYLPFVIGGICFIFWGWKGAIGGALVGAVILGLWYLALKQSMAERESNQSQEDNSESTFKNTTNEHLLKFRILALVASVMKVDGRILKAEVDSVKPFLLKHYGIEGGKEALQILKHLLSASFDPNQVASELKSSLSYSSRLEVLHMLFTIAHSDGDYAASEKKILVSISIVLGITIEDFNAISALFAPRTNNNWAYAALEISQNVSDEEVKRAYHRMAMKYHPDKIIENEELKKSATEKFREIKRAYDFIKKERNII